MSNPTGKKYRKYGDRDAPLYKAFTYKTKLGG